MKKIFLLIVAIPLLAACSNKDNDEDSDSNISDNSIWTYIALNNKMEVSIEQNQYLNYERTDELNSKKIMLIATGAEINHVANAEKHLKSILHVNELTKEICNFLIEKNYQLLIESVGSESALNAIKGEMGEPIEWLFEDERGYKYLKDLSWFTKKDDHVTTTRFFVGPDHNNIAEDGKEIVERLINYRNELCIAIANYSEGEGDHIRNYSFDPTGIPKLKYLGDDSDYENFNFAVDDYVASQRVRPDVQFVLKNIILRLTLPEMVFLSGGVEYPWVAAQFENTPIVAATAIFTSLRMDIIGAESLASKLISNRVRY